ncbi:MAG: GntR family transcriptional regulator [Streptococcaceae bacterium]|jgi:GntR family transcriptional regulator|nr:GntR family transcriptional regulator [Streptococcaceae bacterium]
MSLPRYTQIHDQIQLDIEAGIYPVGGRLPSERELSQAFQVSRATLRQALRALCDEGILEQRVGSGTFVVGNRVKEAMHGTTSFTEIVSAQGKEATSKVISYQRVQANSAEAEKLGLRIGAAIVRMERIRFADKEPICFEIACIPAAVIKGLDKSQVSEHFFATLAQTGKIIDKSEQIISARQASAEIAKMLEIRAGSAILTVSQVSYFKDGTAFEYVRTSYVGERFEFYLER